MWVSWVTWKQITRDVSKKPQILAAMYICTWSFQKKKNVYMYMMTKSITNEILNFQFFKADRKFKMRKKSI